MARITARMVSELSEKPRSAATAAAGMIEAGIVAAGISVVLKEPRKMKITATITATDCASVVAMFFRFSRINSASL